MEDLKLEMLAAGFSQEKQVSLGQDVGMLELTVPSRIVSLPRCTSSASRKCRCSTTWSARYCCVRHAYEAQQALSPLFIETHRLIVENPL
jgi:hypothetical protein